MDYYSGGNGESSYSNLDEQYTHTTGFGNIFRDNSNIILIIMAMAIVALIALYLVYAINHKDESSGPDTNSSLKSLSVVGGTLEPDFNPKETEYVVYIDGSGGFITGDSDFISFTCTAASSKSKITGCDETIDMTDKNTYEHVIKVTAEDTGVTRYRLSIKRR